MWLDAYFNCILELARSHSDFL
jgi:hypothetical protein